MEAGFEIIERNLIISVIGDIDHHNAAEIKERADKLILRENIKNVVFDFSKVTFMDSSGIGMIIGRYKLVEKKGGSAAICSMAPEIKKLFDISGLGKIINHYADSKEALSKMQ